MILTRYILLKHLGPFLFSSISLFLIFVLQFLMKFAENLVGKGLDTWVVIQLIIYNLAWMVALIVPMAVLIATLMAFGGLSQTNEIMVMKAAGISFYKMTMGPFIASIFVAVLLFYFNNNILPDANHQAKFLLTTISQTRPTLSLQPGVFSQEVTNYAILARQIDQSTNVLLNITLYDYHEPSRITIVTAKEGTIAFSADRALLLMDLKSGEIHEANIGDSKMYRRIRFERHRISMDASQFALTQSVGVSRTEREMSVEAMMHRVDSLRTLQAQFQVTFEKEIAKYFLGDSTSAPFPPELKYRPNYVIHWDQVSQRVKAAEDAIRALRLRYEYFKKEINKYLVEVHKKYSIPVACFIFIVLGAPLGAMTRKGGFGMAASISLFFFIIYWAFLIGGEKMADRGIVTPFWGMWAVNFIMFGLGIFLYYRSVRDMLFIDFSALYVLIPKRWRPKKPEDENNSGSVPLPRSLRKKTKA